MLIPDPQHFTELIENNYFKAKYFWFKGSEKKTIM